MDRKLIREEVPYLDQDFLTNYVAANSDVHLICCDGVTVKATRLHLAALSPFMRQLLTRNEDGEPITIHTESHSEDMTSFMLFLMSGCIVSQSPLQSNEMPKGLVQAFAEFGMAPSEIDLTPDGARKQMPHGLLNALTLTDIPEDPLGTANRDDEEELTLAQRKSRKRKKRIKSIDVPEVAVKVQYEEEYEIKQEVVDDDEWLQQYNTGHNDYVDYDFYQENPNGQDLDQDFKPKRKKRKTIENGASNSKEKKTRSHDKVTLKNTRGDLYYFPQKGEVDRTRPYQCTMCVRKFEGEIDFKVHVKRHNRENNRQIYFCISCDKASFELAEDFAKHRAECEDSSWASYLKKYTKEAKDLIFHFPQNEADDLSFKYRCKRCIRVFFQNEHFEQHLRRHVSDQTPQEAFHCLLCNTLTFSNRTDLREHAKDCKNKPENHHPLPEKFLEIYEQHGMLGPNPHTKQRTGERQGSFPCPVCGVSCTTQFNMRKHIRKMGPFHVSNCLSCDYRYLSWEDHVNHVKEAHDGVMLHGCGKCDLVFRTVEEKNSHRITSHFPKHEKPKDPKAHKKTQDQLQMRGDCATVYCEVCGKGVTKGHYPSHLAIKHGKGNVTEVCSECGKIFNNIQVYKKHMKTHFKNHMCDLCGHACASADKLKAHVLSKHTPENLKPFYCQECDQGFVYKNKYSDHMNIHLKLRPYKCLFCNDDYRDGSNVLTHMKKKHPDEYEEYKRKKYAQT